MGVKPRSVIHHQPGRPNRTIQSTQPAPTRCRANAAEDRVEWSLTLEGS